MVSPLSSASGISKRRDEAGSDYINPEVGRWLGLGDVSVGIVAPELLVWMLEDAVNGIRSR